MFDLSYQPISGELLMKLDRRDEAATVYLDLINRNPENWNYYKGLEDAVRPGMITVNHCIHVST